MSDLTVTGYRIGAAAVTAPSAKNQTNDQVPVKATPVPAQKSEPVEPKSAEIPLDDNTRLSIQLDKASGHYVFRSIDPQTGEVVAQYPTREILAQIAHFRSLTGLTVDEDA